MLIGSNKRKRTRYFQTMAHVSIGGSHTKEKEPGRAWDGGHTFSKPKNLSVPSSRKGPAFCSIFSSGVNSGTISSFFLGTTSLVVCAVDGCRVMVC